MHHSIRYLHVIILYLCSRQFHIHFLGICCICVWLKRKTANHNWHCWSTNTKKKKKPTKRKNIGVEENLYKRFDSLDMKTNQVKEIFKLNLHVYKSYSFLMQLYKYTRRNKTKRSYQLYYIQIECIQCLLHCTVFFLSRFIIILTDAIEELIACFKTNGKWRVTDWLFQFFSI